MKLIKKTVFLAATLLATAAPAHAIVIDFTDRPLGVLNDNIGGQYAFFHSSTGSIYVGASGIDHEICAYDDGDCDAPLYALFQPLTHNLTFQVSGVEGNSQLYVAGEYYRRPGPLEHFEILQDIQNGSIIDLSRFGNIESFTVGSNDPAGISYNYFTFDVGALQTVPEPSTWALMIGGFGFIGAARRRRELKSIGAVAAS